MQIVSGPHFDAVRRPSPHARLLYRRRCQGRDVFKQSVLAAGVQACVRVADAHPNARAHGLGNVAVLFAGDMKLGKDVVAEALADVDASSFGSLAVHHVDQSDALSASLEERDFIISSVLGRVTTEQLPIAWDRQHRGVGLVFDGPITPHVPDYAPSDARRTQRSDLLFNFAQMEEKRKEAVLATLNFAE